MKPWIQVSIDTKSIAAAKSHISHALAIDAEWVEVGTPLLTFAGIESIGSVVKLVGDRIVVADFKALDGVEQYFERAGELGAGVATVMAVANDASIEKSIEVGHKNGVKIQVDLLNIPTWQIGEVSRKIAEMGADYFLLHLAIDELLRNPSADPLEGLQEVLASSSVPVGPVVFNKEQGVEAINAGASYVVIGYPLLLASDAEWQMVDFAESIRNSKS